MTHLQNSFVQTGVRKNRRKIQVVAFCTFATALALTAPTEAQSRNERSHPVPDSEQLLSAIDRQHAGEYNAARDILQKALSKTPESAALLNALGSVQEDMGEYFEAERSYLHALSVSAEGASDAERAMVLQNLGTLYLDTNQYLKGEQIRKQLEKLQPGVLKDHAGEAGALLNVIASLEHARNRDDEAERYYSESLHRLHQAHGPISVDAALVETNLGFVRLDARQYESAAALFREAILEIEIAAGPETPALIRPLIDLAGCENMRGHPNQAQPFAHRAVELSLKAFGEGHPVTATAMLHEAASLRGLRRKKLARDLEKRAKASLRRNSSRNLGGYTVGLQDLASAAAR